MKRAVAPVLIILGCVVFMPNTDAQPSPAPKSPPRVLVGRNDGHVQQSGAALPTGVPVNIIRQDPSDRSPPPPHGYVGRNDGRVQQSSQGGQQATKKLKGSATNAAGGSPAVQLNKFSNMTFKPTTAGRPTTVGALGTSPAPKKAIWSVNAESGVVTRPVASGASQGHGKPADGKKKTQKVSPVSSPR